jgi:uncharacterized protein YegP (UPF0339 family)
VAFVEIYRDKDKLRRSWRWRRVAGNGRIMASAGEGFTRKSSAKRAAKQEFPNDEIRDA